MLLSLPRSRATTRWVLTLLRSSSGFRLMNMRPRLTEALKPEAPTEEPSPATAGSVQHDVHRLQLQLLHRLERNIGRGLRAAEDQPGVVLREIALRRLDVEPDGERYGCDEHDQRQRVVVEHEGEGAVVEAHEARERALDQAVEPGAVVAAAPRARNRRRSSASPTATPRSRRRWRRRASPKTRGTAGRRCRP